MPRPIRLALPFILALTASLAAAEPMHVYLTYSGAPETSIDINVIMPETGRSVEVNFDTQSRDGTPGSYAQHTRAKYFQTLMELSDDRAMYAAQITGLKPGTVYYFVAGDEEDGYSAERTFRTLPGGDKPFRFVNGGDMGVDGAVVPLLKLAGARDPDFGLIGGDIAYANGLLANNRLWDRWLSNWDDHMVTSDGRMVPMVMAIGNHEINDYVSTDPELCAPWYTSLFGRQAANVYWSLRIGDNCVFYLLDTGHLASHAGPQTDWLDAELSRYKDVRFKFAAYHVPLYPTHRPYDGGDSVLGRTHWGPLFDKYELTVGMEHHDHVFKRSKPLRGGQVADGGTIFIGDGCFGREARTVDPQPRWYNEKELSAQHFWVVNVSKRELEFEAIDKDGKSIDRFSLPSR